jgi:uncharacterized protein
MRDGIVLNAILYRHKASQGASPALFTHTPYVADTYHGAGIFFASHGFPFLVVDCRGRGNSTGKFRPYHHDRDDGYDIVEWIAAQPWCNGKVGMGGGSYSGFNQWAAARDRPPHLATITPKCSAYPGVDFPMRNNIGEQYSLQWLAYVAGQTSQTNLFWDWDYWRALSRDRFVAGKSFRSLATEVGFDSSNLREWIEHPQRDEYWDALTPSPQEYAQMHLPVLTITGSYDDNQQGALEYYRNSLRHGSPALVDHHYLIIGPWDHSGVGMPRESVGGVKFGAASLIDMRSLSLDWYRWTMCDGSKPAFLADRVAYYVAGSERWRYANSLEAVTAQSAALFLTPSTDTTRLATPGLLGTAAPARTHTASYVYDPRDMSTAELEATFDPFDPTDIRMLLANDGKQLVFESAPLERPIEIAGFFRLDAWLSIDQPDTDFRVLVYLIAADGSSILLTNDTLRARYADSLRTASLSQSREPRLYRFDRFWFNARLLASGERLRLVLGPWNSIQTQKNYNSGKPIADETLLDARAVTVTLHSGPAFPSALYLPYAAADEG